MNYITKVTKNEIYRMFSDGIMISGIFEHADSCIYQYSGILSEVDFLSNLYDLSKIPSYDSRTKNAAEEIARHTHFQDYPVGWIFNDDRFPIKNGSDDEYLRFICYIFHPEVRPKEDYICDQYFEAIKNALYVDGYELYISSEISGRPVWGWRRLSKVEIANNGFVPYSIREGSKFKHLTIKRPIRNQILALVRKYDDNIIITTESGWKYNQAISEAVIEDIKIYYKPKAYNAENQYIETSNIEDVILHGSPKEVFDILEYFAKYVTGNFEKELNLRLNYFGWGIQSGKISILHQPTNIIEPEKDKSLKELIYESQAFYNNKEFQYAIEKLWDAFERLKTYYSDKSKKESVNNVISAITEGHDKDLLERLNKEFRELTEIGNQYRIRHFETDKKEILDDRIKIYLYQRCLSLINLSLSFIDR